MNRVPRLKTVMQPFPYTVNIDEPLLAARTMMRERRVRHLPVKDRGGALVGVVTDRDVKLVLGPYVDRPDDKILVRHACRTKPITFDLETPLDRVLDRMIERRVGSVLVTKDDRLAGIFTTVDACHLLASYLRASKGGDAVA